VRDLDPWGANCCEIFVAQFDGRIACIVESAQSEPVFVFPHFLDRKIPERVSSPFEVTMSQGNQGRPKPFQAFMALLQQGRSFAVQ
jgi:hypothetical protein